MLTGVGVRLPVPFVGLLLVKHVIVVNELANVYMLVAMETNIFLGHKIWLFSGIKLVVFKHNNWFVFYKKTVLQPNIKKTVCIPRGVKRERLVSASLFNSAKKPCFHSLVY